MRKIHKNIPVLFEPYDYKVVETHYSEENNKNNESIFNVANGYIGLRGFFEEGFYGNPANTDPTTMINGVYEYFNYNHVWQRPGFPSRYHAIINQANPVDIKVYVGDELCTLAGNVTGYSRTLDMRDGTIVREFTYQTKAGEKVLLRFHRFASQADKHLLMVKTEVIAQTDADIRIVSSLEQQKRGGGATKEEIGASVGKVYTFLDAKRKSCTKYITYKTNISNFEIICAVSEKVTPSVKPAKSNQKYRLSDVYSFAVKKGEHIVLERAVVYATMRDFSQFKEEAIRRSQEALKAGYAAELEKNKAVWDKFWDATDVSIDDDALIQQGIRYGMFNMYQSTGKDGITNVSANGITGTAYSGHYFWDTEIFMMPMFLYTNPEIVKKLIEYRYNTLDGSRKRAREMEHPGALIAWNTINGEECGHVFEAATAHYHINADIGYSIYKYFEATQEEEFLLDKCAEILFETSLCLSHRGNFIERKGNKFCFNVVCGPDEYNPVVDNNLFTNMMVRKHFYFSLEVADRLRQKRPEKFKELTEKCKIDEEEFARWKRAADNMYLAYDYENDMYMQDDSILYKDPIDIENIPPEKLPLLFTMHPLNLWRFKVCKQADIVLLTFLLHEEFTPQMRKKIYDVYEPLTIHDSSLSSNTYSIVACDIGYYGEAYDYLKQASRMDLDNVNKNTYFGLHAACMGSCWMMLVNGYAGLRVYDEKMHFKPYCDAKWNSYSFKLRFRDSVLHISVKKDKTSYRVLSGAPLEIYHKDQLITVGTEEVVLEN